MTSAESVCVRAYAQLRNPRLHTRTWEARRERHHAEVRWRAALDGWHAQLGAARGWHIVSMPEAHVPCSHSGTPVFYADAQNRCCALSLHAYLPPEIRGLKRARIPFAAYGPEDLHVVLFTGDVLAALNAAQPTPDLARESYADRDRSVVPRSHLWLTRI